MKFIGIPILMYLMLVAMALVSGALGTIIFINLVRKNKPFALVFIVLAVLSITYQLVILYGISLSLGSVVLVIYAFYAVAAYRKLKAEPSAG